MYSVFIAFALLIICILGRLTNALLFAGIMKSHQTRSPIWLALDFTTGCLCLTLIGQVLLLIGLFTSGLTISLLVLALFIELALIIYRNRLPYISISYQYVCIACLVGFAATALSLHEPGLWDDTAYHLIVARDFATNGDLTPNLFLRYPYTPFNVDILFAICFFTAGFDPILSVNACQALATAPLFLIIILLWGVVYRGTKNISCSISALILFFALFKTSITVHVGYAYTDYPVALFTFVAFTFLLFAHYHKCAPRNYILPGAICGLVAGSKYQAAAIITIIIVAVVIILALHKKWKNIIFLLCSFLVFGSYWYIRNFIQDGNPVEPFLIKIFGSKVWSYNDFVANASDIRYQHPHGLSAIIPNYLWVLIFVWIVVSVRIIGLLINIRKSNTKKIQYLDCVGIGLTIYSFMWIELFPIPRYLLPTIGILIFYTTIILNHYLRKINYFVLLTILVIVISYRLTMKNQFSWDNKIKQRELFEIASTLSDSKLDRVLTIDVQERNKYFFNGVTIGDLYGNARFSNFYSPNTEELLPPSDFIKSMEKWKATFAIVSNRVLNPSRINEFKRYFHIIKHNQGYFGGFLLEQLKPINACTWLSPHSSWIETNIQDNIFANTDNLKIFINSSRINRTFCKNIKTPSKLKITIKLGELSDWNNLLGSIKVSTNEEKLLIEQELNNLPIEYDDEGKRYRLITFDIPTDQYTNNINWLNIEFNTSSQQKTLEVALGKNFIYFDPISNE